MSFLEALFLGLVEGFTEFLPISSTGHLLLAQRSLGIERGDASDAWAIVMQAGAIVAVLALYPARCKQALAGILGRDEEGRALSVNLMVAFIPAAILGLLAGDFIPVDLGPVAWAWLGGGVVMLVFARKMRPEAGGRDLKLLSLSGALGVGVFQCAAFLPGTSRSLATILGGVLVGLSIAAAVEFSFLLGLVTVLAASLYKGWGAHEVLFSEYSIGVMLTGAVAAFLSAALTMRWLVSWIQTRGLEAFAWYRVTLGVAVLAWMEGSS